MGTGPVRVRVARGEPITSDHAALHRDLAIGNFFVALAGVADAAAALLEDARNQEKGSNRR